MSIPAQRPCLIEYSPRSSGDVQTGELQAVRGGGRKATVWSGDLTIKSSLAAAFANGSGHILLFSGAGRLNSILPHLMMQSGLAVFFYDAGVPSFGTGVSGQPIIGMIPQVWLQGQSGTTSFASFNGEPLLTDLPFNSGLCVAASSGCPGFTVSWTPEVNSNWPNT